MAAMHDSLKSPDKAAVRLLAIAPPPHTQAGRGNATAKYWWWWNHQSLEVSLRPNQVCPDRRTSPQQPSEDVHGWINRGEEGEDHVDWDAAPAGDTSVYLVVPSCGTRGPTGRDGELNCSTASTLSEQRL